MPDFEEYGILVKRVQHLEEDYNFLKTLLLGERWLNRNQAMIALNCRDDKLRILTLRNSINYRYEGRHPFYCAFSIREYLKLNYINSKEIDKRIIRSKLKGE